MRRLVVVASVAFLSALAACGGGGGGTQTKHPDAAGDGLGAADHPSDAPGSEPEVASDAVAGDVPGDTAPDAGADGADATSTGDADGAADVADAVSDAADGAEAAGPRLVTVAFTGKVVTVAGTPLGFDGTVRLEAVSGTFTYDLRLLDDQPSDPKRGKYQRAGTTAFSFTLKGHTVTGSGKAIVQTENLDPDTFRFLDGPQGDTVVRTMLFDGAAAPLLKLGIAITDGDGVMLASDALPDPFPTLDIANKVSFKVTHTFSLMDGNGTLLMQLDTLVSQ
jgi:hypothetical protein